MRFCHFCRNSKPWRISYSLEIPCDNFSVILSLGGMTGTKGSHDGSQNRQQMTSWSLLIVFLANCCELLLSQKSRVFCSLWEMMSVVMLCWQQQKEDPTQSWATAREGPRSHSFTNNCPQVSIVNSVSVEQESMGKSLPKPLCQGYPREHLVEWQDFRMSQENHLLSDVKDQFVSPTNVLKVSPDKDCLAWQTLRNFWLNNFVLTTSSGRGMVV